MRGASRIWLNECPDCMSEFLFQHPNNACPFIMAFPVRGWQCATCAVYSGGRKTMRKHLAMHRRNKGLI